VDCIFIEKNAEVPFDFVYILFIDKEPRKTIHHYFYDGVILEVDECDQHCLVWSQT
jgi:hypothetical protein